MWHVRALGHAEGRGAEGDTDTQAHRSLLLPSKGHVSRHSPQLLWSETLPGLPRVPYVTSKLREARRLLSRGHLRTDSAVHPRMQEQAGKGYVLTAAAKTLTS